MVRPAGRTVWGSAEVDEARLSSPRPARGRDSCRVRPGAGDGEVGVSLASAVGVQLSSQAVHSPRLVVVHGAERHTQSTWLPVQTRLWHGWRLRIRGTHVRAVPLLASLNLQNIQSCR